MKYEVVCPEGVKEKDVHCDKVRSGLSTLYSATDRSEVRRKVFGSEHPVPGTFTSAELAATWGGEKDWKAGKTLLQAMAGIAQGFGVGGKGSRPLKDSDHEAFSRLVPAKLASAFGVGGCRSRVPAASKAAVLIAAGGFYGYRISPGVSDAVWTFNPLRPGTNRCVACYVVSVQRLPMLDALLDKEASDCIIEGFRQLKSSGDWYIPASVLNNSGKADVRPAVKVYTEDNVEAAFLPEEPRANTAPQRPDKVEVPESAAALAEDTVWDIVRLYERYGLLTSGSRQAEAEVAKLCSFAGQSIRLCVANLMRAVEGRLPNPAGGVSAVRRQLLVTFGHAGAYIETPAHVLTLLRAPLPESEELLLRVTVKVRDTVRHGPTPRPSTARRALSAVQELIVENERLAAKVSKLEAELAKAREAEKKLEALRAALG